MIDPLSIATDGYLSKYNQTLSIVSRGYISTFALIVIALPKREAYKRPDGSGGAGAGDSLAKQQHDIMIREDEEMILIIQIFMSRWD